MHNQVVEFQDIRETGAINEFILYRSSVEFKDTKQFLSESLFKPSFYKLQCSVVTQCAEQALRKFCSALVMKLNETCC